MKTLNETQIKKVEAFLDKKEVKYYDLKIELTDHICTAIEEIWIENSKLSFEEALEKVYKSFGIFGFTMVIEKREESLRQHYWKSIGRHMLQWLKLPQIFLTILIGYILLYGFNSDYKIILRNSIIIGTGLLMISCGIRLALRNWKREKQNRPIILIDHIIATSCSGGLHSVIAFIMVLDADLTSSYSPWLWTFISLLICFMTYHLVYDFPKNKRKYFRNSFIWV